MSALKYVYKRHCSFVEHIEGYIDAGLAFSRRSDRKICIFRDFKRIFGGDWGINTARGFTGFFGKISKHFKVFLPYLRVTSGGEF